MKKKLTDMGITELYTYRDRWESKQLRFKSGSKKWLKCQRRVKRANKLITQLLLGRDKDGR